VTPTPTQPVTPTPTQPVTPTPTQPVTPTPTQGPRPTAPPQALTHNVDADDLFDTGSWTLKNTSRLDEIAQDYGTRHGQGPVQVDGYADTRPIQRLATADDPTGNITLSQNRADAVANYLRDKLPGVDVEATGHGPTTQFGSNKENRRVEVTFSVPGGGGEEPLMPDDTTQTSETDVGQQ
jgi:outer membrane protein OmpA-like peptidoglycan-associated protein